MRSKKIAALEELKQECYGCEACGLHKNTVDGRDPHVFAYGNVNPVLAVVAMNPGEEETKKRKPLIGRSGKLYEEDILTGIGLTRKQVYTTNVVKCVTAGRREPTPEEQERCKHFLRKELEIVKPSFVVTLGNTALEYFTGHRGITKCHGVMERSERFEVDVFPMLHPSAVLRSRTKMGPIMHGDIESLSQIVKELLAPEGAGAIGSIDSIATI